MFRRFADAGTRLRNRTQTDPFFTARLQLMGLYLAVGAGIFMLLGWYVSSIRFEPILELTGATQPGTAAQMAYAAYQQERLIRRLLLVGIFVVATYFLTEFALRSIRRSVTLQHRFFGAVSHELRTPLTVMKNTAEVALRNPHLDEERAHRVIESMLEETDRMARTVRFLLSFTSLSLQRRIPDVETLSLSSIAEEAADASQDAAAARGVALSCSLAIESPVRGNAAALYGLVQNLLANALKHTPPGGSVTVAVFANARDVTLAVADTGSGIRRADMPHIFEPFYQGKDRDFAREGFGLGLSIVREVVRLHRARISVESAPGAGTSFTVHFRRAALSPRA